MTDTIFKPILDKIESPNDLRRLKGSDLEPLAKECREFFVALG